MAFLKFTIVTKLSILDICGVPGYATREKLKFKYKRFKFLDKYKKYCEQIKFLEMVSIFHLAELPKHFIKLLRVNF